jgi:hypothetical protein
MASWHRHDGDTIASARLPPNVALSDDVQDLVNRSSLSYSGIVLSGDETMVSGRGIETACYEEGGLLWLHRDYEEKTETIGPFPLTSLLATLSAVSRSYARDMLGIKKPKAIVDAAWAVCQREGDYATVHDHTAHRPIDGRFVSGIYYLKVPLQINPKCFPNGCLHFVGGRSVTYVPPVPNCVVMWPAELLHGAHPFRGPGDRLAVAFNSIVSEGEQ